MCPEMRSVEEIRVCENQDRLLQMAWAKHTYPSDMWTWEAAGSVGPVGWSTKARESQSPSWVAIMAF